jgi:small nuclear ribonucleoprotein (snRNP)-like protein
VFLTLKIVDNFENVVLAKVVHIYVRAWMDNIHDMKSICSQNLFISNMQC